MKISDSTSISMPMRNLISIIGAVAVGVWAYFGVVERLNKLETQSVLLEKDMTAEDQRLHNEVTKNTDFRIRYLIIRFLAELSPGDSFSKLSPKIVFCGNLLLTCIGSKS